MQLNLYTPKSGQALLLAPETRPEVTSAWLKQLATASPEEAAQKLLAELGRLNRSELNEDLRAELAHLYEPTVHKLTEAVVRMLPENGTPQSIMHRQAANLACEMTVELAHAWKMTYRGLEQRRAIFGGAKAKQLALAHLLGALSGQICTSYRTYTSPPVHSWRELHQVREALLQEGMPDPAGIGQTAAENAYKRALLLALADPFRFTRPEIEVIMAYLDRFGQLAQLGNGSKNAHSVFLIDTSADTPFQQNAQQGATSLALDTRDLYKHLRGLVVKIKTGEPFRDIGLDEPPQKVNALHLFSRLLQAWRGAQKRGFNRYEPGLSFVEVISGIPAIHRLFDEKQKPVPARTSAVAVNTHTPLSDQSLPARWRVINDSASGLAISAHAQEVAQVRMGNPIALRGEHVNGDGWMLAVIRWGKMTKGQLIVAGVEKLSPETSSVVLRFLEDNSENIGQPALLIPSNPVLQTEERLLLPQGLYKRGRTADMWLKGERRRIGLGSLVEETVFFDIVEVLIAP